MKYLRKLYYRARYRRERRLGDASNMIVARIAIFMQCGAPAPEGDLLKTLVSDMHRHYDRADQWKRKIDTLDLPRTGEKA